MNKLLLTELSLCTDMFSPLENYMSDLQLGGDSVFTRFRDARFSLSSRVIVVILINKSFWNFL